MTLTDDELGKLLKATDGQPVGDVITLACETLTLKIVLLLKMKSRELSAQMAGKEPGTAERANVAGQVNALKRFSVELAEQPHPRRNQGRRS